MTESSYDVVIIGGGPAGLSAGMYTARAKLRTVVLDKNPAAGALGHAAWIENYPAVLETKSGLEMLHQFRRHAEMFGADVVRAQVLGVDLSKSPREVYTGDAVYYGETVIIATGNMGRTSFLPGEETLIGHGVSYCTICDAAFFKDSPVAVIGTVPRVMDELESIARFSSRIYLLTPQKTLTPEHLALVRSIQTVELLAGSKVTMILGEIQAVTGIRYSDQTGDHQIAVDGVFIFLHGTTPVVDFLGGQVEINARGCIQSDRHSMKTSVEGVFAAGDVTCKEVRQITVAVGEGCIAAISAERYLAARRRAAAQA